jgi:hypothetical protein
MVSHPRKSTNPFDMALESDVEANDMVFIHIFCLVIDYWIH